MSKSIVKVTSILAMLALMVGIAIPAIAASTTTTANVKDMLLNTLHEERLAAATYQAIIDKFGEIKPFTNILEAEKNHIAAVENLLKINDIEIPQNDVTVTAPNTIEQAYALATKVEKEDIALYEKMYPQISDTMIKTVFTRLSNASERHLKAFEAYANGETLEGQQTKQMMENEKMINGGKRHNGRKMMQGQNQQLEKTNERSGRGNHSKSAMNMRRQRNRSNECMANQPQHLGRHQRGNH